MGLLTAIAVCVALVIGMTAAVSVRRRRGSGTNVDGGGGIAGDLRGGEWKWKAHMGGGGGHQGGNTPFSG